MLPTFVIGLREGMEAALTVGIIAAFLGQSGRRDALPKVWVGLATLICVAFAIGLHLLSDSLDFTQQERLETVIGLFAVMMVTYMVLWMSRHARDMKGQLVGAATEALAKGSTRALTDAGCQPSPNSAPAGVVNFKVNNDNANGVSEAELLSGGKILGEQENLSPGLSGGFSLRLDNGSYQIYCPGAAQEHWDFTVTGQSTASWRTNPALVAATTQYATWITGQVNQLTTSTQSFVDAVNAGDLQQAEVTYGAARVFYERVEPVAEIWGSLYLDIDGRIDDFDKPADFQGFHKHATSWGSRTAPATSPSTRRTCSATTYGSTTPTSRGRAVAATSWHGGSGSTSTSGTGTSRPTRRTCSAASSPPAHP
jgi:hypothetical protein